MTPAFAWARLRGSGLKTRLLHPHEEFWDRRLGIGTFGFVPAVGDPDHEAWQGHYQPTSYRDLFRMLRQVKLGPGDVYVDFGCGLGRTVFVAHRLGASRAIGVEIDRTLVEACRANLARSGADPGAVRFVEGYAQDFAEPGTSVVFLFHPFGRGTLRAVLDRLGDGHRTARRTLRLVYFNAVADDVLAASGFLRCTGRWVAGRDWRPTSGPYDASFWST